MNRRELSLLLAIAVVILSGVVFIWLGSRSLHHRPAPMTLASPGPSIPAIPTAASSSPAGGTEEERQITLVKQGFEAIVSGMKKAGGKEVPPIENQLREAVTSGDHGKIIRAFHEAIYDSFAKMSEAIPAIRQFLNHPDPFVRFQAAEKLYIAGDQSGFAALLGIMSAPEPVLMDGNDARIKAARLFAKYRESRASSAITELYEQTKDSGVLNALVRLQRESTSADVISNLLEASHTAFGLFNLSLTDTPEVAAAAKETFPAPKVPAIYEQETKNIAAWAALRAGEKQPYLSYLMNQAEQAVRNERPHGNDVDVNQFKKALKYVASIPDESAKSLLEQALSSNSQEIVQIAVVNLLFNQPVPSDKAKRVVLRELRGEQNKLGAELMLNIAVHLDDSEIRAAGEKFDQRTGENAWKHAVDRQHWPIYNWIDDYVVALK